MLDVVVPEAHQNNHSYVHKLSVPSWWVVKQKKHRSVKIGGWALAWDNTVSHFTLVIRIKNVH